MINSIQDTALVLASNTSNIPFSSDVVRTRSANCCDWLGHASGSAQYQLTEPGIYEIQFSANVTAATIGQVALAIKSNGEVLSGTEMDSTIDTAGVYASVSSNRLLRICCRGNATITVGSIPTVGTTATQIPTVKNVSLIIKKVA